MRRKSRRGDISMRNGYICKVCYNGRTTTLWIKGYFYTHC